MANTIEKQVINDGKLNYKVKVHIDGDGSGDEAATLLIDVSTLNHAPTGLVLISVNSALVGFTAELEWDATTNIHFWEIPDYDHSINLGEAGIPNNAGAGVTGDVDITTTGLGAGDTGHMVLLFEKRYD